MLYRPVFTPGFLHLIRRRNSLIVTGCLLPASVVSLLVAQTYEPELTAGGKTTFTIKNRTGRVTVITSDNEKTKPSLQATSVGAPVEPGDISVSGGEITVRERRPQDRIDLTVHVPARSRVKIESESGMVDVIGDFELADVVTNTGTIHADVPVDALKFKFLWQASHPRFLSDVELPRVKEGRAGTFSISGLLGPDAKRKKHKNKSVDTQPTTDVTDHNTETQDQITPDSAGAVTDKPDKKNSAKDKLVQLNLTTQRGVILLNVDPTMAPSDLRERPLTEAARAIVRSGNEPLVNAIRTVGPRMFGDYARTLPPPRNEPMLVALRRPGQVATEVAPQLIRVNASVTDRFGRAIAGMHLSDFSVYEDGNERQIFKVKHAY